MHPKLPKCDRCWSRSMSSNRKVSRSRSRQVVAWDLHSHLSLEKSNGIEQLLLFFCLFFSKCVAVSNASGSRSCFIILHHAAYVKSCEDIYIYICEDVRTPRSFQKNRFRNKTSSNQKNILHTQFMEAKTDQKCWSRYRPPEETNHMNHSHQLQVQLEQIKKDALCSERIWYNRY